MNLEQRNTELEEKLKETDLTSAVAVLVKDAKRRKQQVIILAISVALDILLTIGLAFGWQQNHRLASRADSNHDAIVRNCETSNEARAKNREIWNYVLDISQRPNLTAEQQKQRDDFIKKLDVTFAPRDCKTIM